jgi:hypothetical protein
MVFRNTVLLIWRNLGDSSNDRQIKEVDALRVVACSRGFLYLGNHKRRWSSYLCFICLNSFCPPIFFFVRSD